MPESRLFMSSLSRRQLARRRPGRLARTPLAPVLLGLALVALACALTLVLARGGI